MRRLRPFFGKLPLASVRPRDVTVFVQDALTHYAPATVNLDVNVLVDIFNSAIREELIETNPAKHVEQPRLTRRRRLGLERNRSDDEGGHADMKTTRRYMHLAGAVFRDEAEALERRLLGRPGGGVAELPASQRIG